MTFFSRAPLTVDLAGTWSALPAFAEAEGGAVVNAAIARYVHVEAILGDKRIRLYDADGDRRVTVPSSREIRYDGTLDEHKAALNMLPVTGGIELLTRCDVPVGSGLGDAGALEVALLALLADARGERYDPDELAEFGCMLEAQELRRSGCGSAQWAAAAGGLQALQFAAAGVRSRAIAISARAIEDFERHVVLLFTGRSHLSSAVWDRVRDGYAAGDPGIGAALRRLRDLALDAERALAAADWRALAEVVEEHWRHQQALDGTMATDRTRAVEAAVRAAGAWAVAAAGAGAGGSLFVLASPDRRDAILAEATGVGAAEIPFTIARRGVDVWQADDAAN